MTTIYEPDRMEGLFEHLREQSKKEAEKKEKCPKCSHRKSFQSSFYCELLQDYKECNFEQKEE